jgi:D-alanyl-D-alanine carboxypeptidase
MRLARSAGAIFLLSICAGCSGSGYVSHWDGRRGYDGNGDYGYDLDASRSEARSYVARAARYYPVPGTPDDPWGPYIHDAASRFQVPERWIREVMRQESGGRQNDSDGMPLTSPAGAMGLMQVMPRTYETLRQRYGLGNDPYDPRDNILAGAAYIREMYNIYGAPGFLAAYNAGPDRLDAYLAGESPLPDETVNYLASVAPRLGNDVAMTGALAAFAGGFAGGTAVADSGQAYPAAADRAYAGGGMTGQDYGASSQSDGAYAGGGMTGQDYYASSQPTRVAADPSAPAYAPGGGFGGYSGGIGTASLPGGAVAPTAAPAPYGNGAPASRTFSTPPAMLLPVAATTPGGDWAIQVGAYADPANSQAAIASARSRAGDLLAGTRPAVTPVQRAGILYRARLVGLSAGNAAAACAALSQGGMDCFAVPPGS